MRGFATEAQHQKAIIEYLQLNRYEVMWVGQFREKPTGSINTKGFPDLCIHHRSWPPGVNVLLEIKKPGEQLGGVKSRKGVLSPEQKTIHEKGMSLVIYGIDDLIAKLATITIRGTND